MGPRSCFLIIQLMTLPCSQHFLVRVIMYFICLHGPYDLEQGDNINDVMSSAPLWAAEVAHEFFPVGVTVMPCTNTA